VQDRARVVFRPELAELGEVTSFDQRC
jgi:hypothetical protein